MNDSEEKKKPQEIEQEQITIIIFFNLYATSILINKIKWVCPS